MLPRFEHLWFTKWRKWRWSWCGWQCILIVHQKTFIFVRRLKSAQWSIFFDWSRNFVQKIDHCHFVVFIRKSMQHRGQPLFFCGERMGGNNAIGEALKNFWDKHQRSRNVNVLNKMNLNLIYVKKQTGVSNFRANNFGLRMAAAKKRIMRKEESARRATSSLPGKHFSTTLRSSAKISRSTCGHRWRESTTRLKANSA